MSTAHLRRLLDQAGQIEHLQELPSNDAIDGELNEETERIVRIEEEAQIVLEEDYARRDRIVLVMNDGEYSGWRVAQKYDEVERYGRDGELAVLARYAPHRVVRLVGGGADAFARLEYEQDEDRVDDDHERERHDGGRKQVEPVE